MNIPDDVETKLNNLHATEDRMVEAMKDPERFPETAMQIMVMQGQLMDAFSTLLAHSPTICAMMSESIRDLGKDMPVASREHSVTRDWADFYSALGMELEGFMRRLDNACDLPLPLRLFLKQVDARRAKEGGGAQ